MGSYLIILMGLLHGVLVSCAGRTWGSAPSTLSGAAAQITCDSGAPLDLVDLVSIEMNEDRAILALLLTLPSVFGW